MDDHEKAEIVRSFLPRSLRAQLILPVVMGDTFDALVLGAVATQLYERPRVSCLPIVIAMFAPHDGWQVVVTYATTRKLFLFTNGMMLWMCGEYWKPIPDAQWDLSYPQAGDVPEAVERWMLENWFGE